MAQNFTTDFQAGMCSHLPVSVLTDVQLIAGFQAGRAACFDELVRRHRSALKAQVRNFCRGDRMTQDDLLQQILIRLHSVFIRGGYEERGTFGPWLRRLAHSVLLDHARADRKRQQRYSDGFDEVANLAEVSTDFEKSFSGVSRKKLRKLVSRLPLEQKQVVILRIRFELTFQEIADFTGVSINTALGRMCYAQSNLRKWA
jgi:RNA polymerase sigma-70 factor (ECF subfamily)